MKYLLFITIFLSAFLYSMPLSGQDVYLLAKQTIKENDFLADAEVLRRIAYVESNYNKFSIGDKGKALGLMQVWQRTSKDLYERLGYRRYHYSSINMLRPEVSMYFAGAYFDWLNKTDTNRSLEWKVRAYNGGRGWENNLKSVINTQDYYNKYLGA